MNNLKVNRYLKPKTPPKGCTHARLGTNKLVNDWYRLDNGQAYSWYGKWVESEENKEFFESERTIRITI